MNALTRQTDAFGLALHDQLAGRFTGAVIERNDGLVEPLYGFDSYFAPMRAWPARQRKAMRFARGRVLDVGCGAGRVALHVQDRGREAVGIDVSPLAINVCKARGLRHAVRLSAGDITPKLGPFDTVVMFGNNFGLLGCPKRTQRFFKRLHAVTSPRARVLAESLDPYRTSDPDHLRYHRENRRRGRWAGQLRIRVRYRRADTGWFDWLMAAPAEMDKLLAGAGWRVARRIDSQGAIYVAVIEKETRR